MARLIETKDVYKIYDEGKESEVRALDGVSIAIDEGEFVAIVGQSGSGKSTLMNILGCLDVPTHGDYILRGTNVKDLSDKKLSIIRNKEIGFIFQQYNLIKTLTIQENVELPLIYQGMNYDKRFELAKEALEKMGIADKYAHYPSQLSGGQQQRVAIARAIAAKPEIIMADEPTGALDSKTGHDILGFLKQFNAEGTTVILITHDNGIAAQARRRIRIADGKIVEDTGEPEEKAEAKPQVPSGIKKQEPEKTAAKPQEGKKPEPSPAQAKDTRKPDEAPAPTPQQGKEEPDEHTAVI